MELDHKQQSGNLLGVNPTVMVTHVHPFHWLRGHGRALWIGSLNGAFIKLYCCLYCDRTNDRYSFETSLITTQNVGAEMKKFQ